MPDSPFAIVVLEDINLETMPTSESLLAGFPQLPFGPVALILFFVSFQFHNFELDNNVLDALCRSFFCSFHDCW